MASKPFYSMDEVCRKLGKGADEIKDLVRDGALREFRDAGKVFFKAEDIDRLASEMGAGEPAPDGGMIELESASDSGDSKDDLTTLADSTGGTSIIGLEPLEDEELAPPPPATGRAPQEPQEDTVITASGIGVFDDDELEIDADPMAKTQITTGATDDQVALDGAGSGSGLLDLAREADDTALGADLLDEIYPGEEEGPAEEALPAEEPTVEAVEEPPPAAEAAAAVLEEPMVEEEVVVRAAPTTADPFEGALAGLLVGALIVMAVGSTVVAGAVQGFIPDYFVMLGDGNRILFVLLGAVLLPAITLAVGLFVGKAFAPRR